MKTFKLKDVCDVLKDSKLYESFIEDYSEDDEISIDDKYWIDDLRVPHSDFMEESAKIEYLRGVFPALNYWGVNDPPDNLYSFISNLRKRDDLEELLKDYPNFRHITEFIRICLLSRYEQLEESVRSKSLPIFKYYVTHYPGRSKKKALSVTARFGQLEMMKYAYEFIFKCNFHLYDYSIYNDAVFESIKHNHYDCMEFAFKNNFPYNTHDLIREFCFMKSIKRIKYFAKNIGISIRNLNDYLDFFLENNRVDLFLIFAEIDKNNLNPSLYDRGLELDSVKIVKFLVENGVKIEENVLLKCRSIEMFKYLRSLGNEKLVPNEDCLVSATEDGYFDLLAHLVDVEKLPLSSKVLEKCISCDEYRFKCFDYLLEKKCPFDHNLCEYICLHGGNSDYLDVATYWGYEVTDACIYLALISKNRDCLDYLVVYCEMNINPILLTANKKLIGSTNMYNCLHDIVGDSNSSE